MEIIKTDNLFFHYGDDKSKNVISNLSLNVNEGETVAILGHNGSGKSTLAKLFNGLLVPSKGKVYVGGMDTEDDSKLYDIRKTVGVVFQNPDNQMVATIIEDDIAFGPENLGLPREEIGKRVDFALSAVGMDEYRKREPFKLSGGQKQRIAIAGVLAIKPKVLVLDESTAMLDPAGRESIMQVVRDLKTRENMTIIMITHFMEEAMEADRVIVLNDGELLLDGTPNEVFAHAELLTKIGLEIPPFMRVKNALEEHGLDLGEVTGPEQLVEKLCR